MKHCQYLPFYARQKFDILTTQDLVLSMIHPPCLIFAPSREQKVFEKILSQHFDQNFFQNKVTFWFEKRGVVYFSICFI